MKLALILSEENMSSKPNLLKTFYERLNSVGFKKAFVQKNLTPTWWKDEMAKESPFLFEEMVKSVATKLSVDFKSLISAENELILPSIPEVKYFKAVKKSVPNSTIQILREIAEIVVSEIESSYVPIKGSVLEIRKTIQELTGKKAIDLPGLLQFAWEQGIPVIHLKGELPDVKPDGVVFRIQNRPVIFICRKETYFARLAFILAHEIGHIACGHLIDNEIVYDESINLDAESDPKEKEADVFACRILFNRPEPKAKLPRFIPKENFLSQLNIWANELEIDLGLIINNLAYTSTKFPNEVKHKIEQPFAKTLQKQLKERENLPEPELVFYEYLRNNMSFENLLSDKLDFLDKMLNISPETFEQVDTKIRQKQWENLTPEEREYYKEASTLLSEF